MYSRLVQSRRGWERGSSGGRDRTPCRPPPSRCKLIPPPCQPSPCPSSKPASGKRKAPEGVTYPWEKQNTPFPPTLAYFLSSAVEKSPSQHYSQVQVLGYESEHTDWERELLFTAPFIAPPCKRKGCWFSGLGQTVSRAEWRTLYSKHNYAKISALEGGELKAIICSNRKVFVNTHIASNTYISFVWYTCGATYIYSDTLTTFSVANFYTNVLELKRPARLHLQMKKLILTYK